MNISALIIALLGGIAVMAMLLGLKNLFRRKIKHNQFTSYYNYKEDDERLKEYKKIINKNNIQARTALTLIVIGGLVIGFITYIVVGVIWISVLSFLGGFLIPNWWYKWHLASNKKTILKQMEQATEIIATVIKTGSSLPEAFERAAQDAKEPLKSELIRTAMQIRIGVSMSSAFAEFTQRVGIKEMMVISIAMDLQETGMAINIPALFNQLQSDIRHKIQFRKSIDTVTSEMRIAGITTAVVPFATVTMMRLVANDFIAPLFNSILGLTIFGVCTGVILFGVKWMFNIAKLEEI